MGAMCALAAMLVQGRWLRMVSGHGDFIPGMRLSFGRGRFVMGQVCAIYAQPYGSQASADNFAPVCDHENHCPFVPSARSRLVLEGSYCSRCSRALAVCSDGREAFVAFNGRKKAWYPLLAAWLSRLIPAVLRNEATSLLQCGECVAHRLLSRLVSLYAECFKHLSTRQAVGAG